MATSTPPASQRVPLSVSRLKEPFAQDSGKTTQSDSNKEAEEYLQAEGWEPLTDAGLQHPNPVVQFWVKKVTPITE